MHFKNSLVIYFCNINLLSGSGVRHAFEYLVFFRAHLVKSCFIIQSSKSEEVKPDANTEPTIPHKKTKQRMREEQRKREEVFIINLNY